MDFKETQKLIHANAKAKGFYESEIVNVGEKLMLIVSELSEALEADRTGYHCHQSNFLNHVASTHDFEVSFRASVKDTFEDELADAVIRIMDLAEYMNINLEWHIEQKMRFNALREYKHGKAY